MTTRTQQTNSRRRVPFFFLAAIVVVLATIFGAATTTAGGETRVGCHNQTVEILAEPQQYIAAGQRLGNDLPGPGLVAATGVAAKKADDWPVLSGIARDAGRGKGNFGVGSGTASQATRAGESWVGEGYRIASDGRTLVSRDGLRTFRPPSWKPDLGKYQANFSYWIGERGGKPFGNGHLDVTDMFP